MKKRFVRKRIKLQRGRLMTFLIRRPLRKGKVAAKNMKKLRKKNGQDHGLRINQGERIKGEKAFGRGRKSKGPAKLKN